MRDIELICNAGMAKYNLMKKSPLQFFMKSVMAGFYLGVAMIISYTLGAMLGGIPGKIAVASLFGLGLCGIIFLGAELFTGNCFSTIMPVYNKQLKFVDLLPMWITCYVGNIAGIAFIGFLYIKSGAQNAILYDYLTGIVTAKLSFNVGGLFIKGILCNFIVCMAAYSGIKVKDGFPKFMLVMLFVMAFVLPGFEHCIANGGIFAMGLTLLGSSVSWSALPMHMLLSTLGNIVGGSVLLGLPVFIMFKD